MTTVPRLLVAVALVLAAAAAAAAQSLKPQWSRPVGGATRLVGVEEYGRCSVFVDNGVVQVVSSSGEVSWTWPFRKISKYLNPRDVTVSHDCGAIALVGDASYKYVWIVDRAGRSASIKFVTTPADVEFDRTGTKVAVGTYAGSMFLYSVNGELQWKRDTEAAMVTDLEFTDDNQRILFKGWGGAGVVSVAGQVEWSQLANRLAASRDLSLYVVSHEPNHGPGLPHIAALDQNRKELWHRWAQIDALVSATGGRVLALVDRKQDKTQEDFLGGPSAGAEVQLLSRDGQVFATLDDHRRPVALSEDGTRMWLAIDERMECVSERGEVLAVIAAAAAYRGVMVSRDFGQVLVVSEKDLHPVSVERYEIPAPCKP